MEGVPAVVVGGGVIGCAVAEALTRCGIIPWVLERGPRIAEGVTSRNSGVIHAGIYYKPGSLKAETCLRGNELLYEWCEKNGVPHRRTGKWIVGSLQEEAELEALFSNAVQSGAKELRRVGIAELQSRIPGTKAETGLFSPQTGIVDPYEFSRSLRAKAEERGAEFVFNIQVSSIERLNQGFEVETNRGPVRTDLLINAAGLFSDEIASLAGTKKYKIYPCRGDYFRLSSHYRFSELIYPVKKKNSPGLGIHLTLTLDGTCKLGPDAEYVNDKENFEPKPEKQEKFYQAARQYLPSLELSDIYYDSCGIRPKLRAPDGLEELDFVVSQDIPGMVNLVGIESPGLTSSLALAEKAVNLILR